MTLKVNFGNLHRAHLAQSGSLGRSSLHALQRTPRRPLGGSLVRRFLVPLQELGRGPHDLVVLTQLAGCRLPHCRASGRRRRARPAASGSEGSQPSAIDDLLTLADGRVTRSTLVALRSSVEDYWRRDDEHGGASLRPAVVGHLRYVSQLMKGADGALLRDLQALAAELARLAGWACFDARQYSTARTHFTQALRLAHHRDDRVFMANVLSCMSLQATYDGNPVDAVALACKAQDSARASGGQPLVMSMLHMREAFAQATMRDSMACRHAIDRSRDAFELSRGRESEAPSWVRYFDESKLIVDTGTAARPRATG